MFIRFICISSLMIFAMGNSWAFDLQGHRGARGLMPENTLPAFAKALSIGVSTLELDTVVTKDGIVVVSHNPVIKKELGRWPNGKWLTTEPIISNLTFEELKKFDVGRLKPGSRAASRFPDQQAVDGTPIPSLAEVFELVLKSGNTNVRFNIETKINPIDQSLTPAPEAFAKALLSVVQHYKFEERVTIQSFDWRTLQVVQKLDKNVSTAYLTAEQDWLNNIRAVGSKASPWSAGFKPEDYDNDIGKLIKAAGGSIWSPFYRDVTAERIKQAHAEGIQVVPWTVNETDQMKKLIALGVDGLISDYPDRLRATLKELKIEIPEPTKIQN